MFPSQKDRLFGVFVKNSKEELEKLGVQFNPCVLIKGKSYSAFHKFFRYLKHYLLIATSFFGGNYELLYVHYLTHHLPILLLLVPFKNRPWVINVHGSDINAVRKGGVLKFFASMILKRIDMLIVPTSQFRDMVKELFPFIGINAIIVSPSGGIDETLFYRSATATKKSNTISLGFISRLTEEKGWKIFLEAMGLLKKEGLQFNALMVGKGEDEDIIKATISAMDLQKEVRFLGFVPQEDLVQIYSTLDLYIFPTFRDSLGLTGLEAMSCGVPVVASNIKGGPTTYIEHGSNGFLFPPKDSYGLSRAILHYKGLHISEKKQIIDNALKIAKSYRRSEVAKSLKKNLAAISKKQASIT